MRPRRSALLVIVGSVLAACAGRVQPFPEYAAVPAVDHVIDLVWGGNARAVEGPLDTNASEVRRLADSMEARFARLRPHYVSGAVGLVDDGYLVLRDANLAPATERTALRTLVANENADRATLYRELAQASGQPQWETRLRKTFGQRWIARAPAGWQVQGAGGWQAR